MIMISLMLLSLAMEIKTLPKNSCHVVSAYGDLSCPIVIMFVIIITYIYIYIYTHT